MFAAASNRNIVQTVAKNNIRGNANLKTLRMKLFDAAPEFQQWVRTATPEHSCRGIYDVTWINTTVSTADDSVHDNYTVTRQNSSTSSVRWSVKTTK